MEIIEIKIGGQPYIFEAKIEPCEEGGFFVYAPEIQGAHAEAETVQTALEILKDVIKIHIQSRLSETNLLPLAV